MLVGPTEQEAFDQPPGEPLFPTVTPEQHAMVFDFGCGCGRLARKLALAAAPLPKRYVGIDLHAGMIRWANENLAPRLENFSFVHHDVFHAGFNPNRSRPRADSLPVDASSVTLLLAVSVFTHLVQDQAEHYLDEVRRVLHPDGVMIATWFIFQKSYFPMMQDFQDALYINDKDPTNAVIFDQEWLIKALGSRGLGIRAADPPALRGYQWRMEIVPRGDSIALPPDEAPFGRQPPPVVREAYAIGRGRASRWR